LLLVSDVRRGADWNVSQDSSEMVAAISNANNKRRDSESAIVARSSCTLEKLANHLLKDHPVLSCVTGNSGNTADVSHLSRIQKSTFPADLHATASGQDGVLFSQ
jgi:hypothetical protein